MIAPHALHTQEAARPLHALQSAIRPAAGLAAAVGLVLATFTFGMSAIDRLEVASSSQTVTMAGSLTADRAADYVSPGMRMAPQRQPGR